MSPEPTRPAPRKRRSLSHVGGRVETRGGDAKTLAVLENALAVRSDERATLAHVHGFHSYPARLHPETAARLVEGFSSPRDSVLDPFCGSGTVLVEARRLGRRAFGVDVNSVAIELTWLKTRGFDADECAAIVAAARAVAESAEERRKAKAGPARRHGADDLAEFEIHVLLELDGLRAAIDRIGDRTLRRALGLVLSAILVKLSRRPGDTSEARVARRTAGGFAIRFFVKKAEELARRLEAYRALVPPGAPPAKAFLGDARELAGIRPASMRLVVSSPPYPGVYDYRDHHARRARWLGLEDGGFGEREIGSRRAARGKRFEQVLGAWERDFGAALAQIRRVLAPGGRAALIIADSAFGGRPVFADRVVARLAPRARLRLFASAAQARPQFHAPSAAAFRGAPRREHVFVLDPV